MREKVALLSSCVRYTLGSMDSLSSFSSAISRVSDAVIASPLQSNTNFPIPARLVSDKTETCNVIGVVKVFKAYLPILCCSGPTTRARSRLKALIISSEAQSHRRVGVLLRGSVVAAWHWPLSPLFSRRFYESTDGFIINICRQTIIYALALGVLGLY
jgi:hypothetical protein